MPDAEFFGEKNRLCVTSPRPACLPNGMTGRCRARPSARHSDKPFVIVELYGEADQRGDRVGGLLGQVRAIVLGLRANCWAYGKFLMGQRQADEPEAALRRAIKLDGSLAGAHANLAELYRATGQTGSQKTPVPQGREAFA
jgi:hypothetical protein